MCAYWGFAYMGKQAELAIPELLNLSCSQTRNTSPDATMLTVAIPELTSLLQDQNLDLRVQAARVLGYMSHFATEAIPGLIELLSCSTAAENVQAANAEPMTDEAKLQGEMDL